MCKSSIFSHILDLVVKETEVPEQLILSSCRKAEVVDARCLLVQLLHESGFYDQSIALLIHKTDKAVHQMRSNFPSRIKFSRLLSINYELIKKELRTNHPITPS